MKGLAISGPRGPSRPGGTVTGRRPLSPRAAAGDTVDPSPTGSAGGPAWAGGLKGTVTPMAVTQ
jgi:hypothetical protein